MAIDPSTTSASGRSPSGNGDGRGFSDSALGSGAYDSAYGEEVHVESLTDSRSPATLLRQLIGDATMLFRKELALAASEITRSVDEAKTGAVSMVSGGAVLYAGVLFLLGAAALGLAEVMPGWAATLIVGGVTALIGFIMVQSGKKRIKDRALTPQRTVESLRKDSDAIRRQVQ